MNILVTSVATAAVMLHPAVPAPKATQPAVPMTRPMPLSQQEPYPPNRPVVGSANTSQASGNWNGEMFRCESRDDRRKTCSADTRGGVRLVRQLSDTPCREGRSWGSDSNSVWVDKGCRGEFQGRFGGIGSNTSNSSSGSGPSTGAIIGGVAVAGGLIALVAKSNSNKKPAPTTGTGSPPPAPAVQPPAFPAPPAGPAKVTAQMGSVTPDARPALGMCLNDAARQIGATGGSEIRLDRIDDVQPGNGGFRFRVQLAAIYPDQVRMIPTYCRATPTQVVELTFG